MPRAAGFSPPVARGVTGAAIPRPGGRPTYDQPMSPDESDDPGADTAMFRAYVEHGDGAEAPTSPGVRPGVLIAAAVVLMIVVLVLILLLI